MSTALQTVAKDPGANSAIGNAVAAVCHGKLDSWITFGMGAKVRQPIFGFRERSRPGESGLQWQGGKQPVHSLQQFRALSRNLEISLGGVVDSVVFAAHDQSAVFAAAPVKIGTRCLPDHQPAQRLW